MKSDNRPYPKGVWFQPKVLSSGERIYYGYFGRGPGMVSLGQRGTPAFFEKLAEVLKKEPPAGNVSHLIWAYKSKALSKLGERTQRDYRPKLDIIEKEFGRLSLRAMGSDALRRDILNWQEAATSSPRQRDYLIQVLSAVLGWGVKQRLIAKNQAERVDRHYTTDRRDKIWSEEQQESFLDSAPEPIRRALIIALETGQRQADLLRLSWGAVKPSIISLRQRKTGVEVSVPISPRLRQCLDAAPRGTATTVLTTDRGLPWEPKGNGFRAAWQDACKKAGIEGVTFHDLRGTFATRRLADGWTREDVAFCTGHSLRDMASLERYVSRGGVAAKRAEAMAKRMAEVKK